MARRWVYVRITSPSEPQSELLAEGLFAAGASSVQQEPDALVSYLPDRGDAAAQISDLRAQLGAAIGGPVELSWERREDEDWAQEWRRGLGPRRIGERLILTPTWLVPDAGDDDVVISIDPQMAFGTGEHATTRGVLQLLERQVTPGCRALDVGTGSGVLSIAAARLGAGAVLAVDNDPDALINAAENIARNGAAHTVELREAQVDEAFLAAHAADGFDLILANVLSGVLRPLLPAFAQALRPAGSLILSGILQEEAEGMRESAAAAGLSAAREIREEEWWTALFRHR